MIEGLPHVSLGTSREFHHAFDSVLAASVIPATPDPAAGTAALRVSMSCLDFLQPTLEKLAKHNRNENKHPDLARKHVREASRAELFEL